MEIETRLDVRLGGSDDLVELGQSRGLDGRGRAGPGLEANGVAAGAGADDFVEAPEGSTGMS